MILLNEYRLIWVAVVPIVLYLLVTYLYVRRCGRKVVGHSRYLLETYGRDMHSVPPTVLTYYRQDLAAYRAARRLFAFRFFLPKVESLPWGTAVPRRSLRLRSVHRPMLDHVERRVLDLGRRWSRELESFNHAVDNEELRLERDLDWRRRYEYLPLTNKQQ